VGIRLRRAFTSPRGRVSRALADRDVALPYASYGAALFSPYVATLDIVLVFLVFKGDVKLT
jgi:hypothetical protein